MIILCFVRRISEFCTMKVSILVPIYNVENYIGKCAESLFSQTYSDLEYVFVNDCTPDGSIRVLEEVLDKYPNRRSQVKIVSHEKNLGLAAARNTGLSNATGDYVFHVDSDDYIRENAIEKLVIEAKKSLCDIVDGAFESVDSNGVTIHKYQVFTGSQVNYVKLLISKLVSPAPNIFARLIRRSLYIENDISNIPGLNYAEDLMVTPKLLVVGSRSYIKDSIYFYRVDNSNSYTQEFSHSNIVSWILVTKDLYNFFTSPRYKEIYGFYAEVGVANLLRVNHYLSFSDEEKALIPDIHTKSIFLKCYLFGLKYKIAYPISALIFRILTKKIRKLYK